MRSLISKSASLIYISYTWKGISYMWPALGTWKQISGAEKLFLTRKSHLDQMFLFLKVYFQQWTVYETNEVFLHSYKVHFSTSKLCKDWGKATSLLWLVKGTKAQLALTCWQKDWMEKENPGGWNTKWGVLIECDDSQIEFSKNVITNLGDKGTVIPSSDHTYTISYIKSEYIGMCV